MEENWKEVKKKVVNKKSTDDKNSNFSRNSQKDYRSDLKNSGEVTNINFQKFKPPSLAKNTVTFSDSNVPKRGNHRGGHRGGGGYRPRKQPEPIPDFKDGEEEERFLNLQKSIPHIKMPGEIRRIAANIRIDGLADKMLSEEWVEFQRDGWEYDKVITPDGDVEIPEDDGYELLSLENKWGDFVLFKKIK